MVFTETWEIWGFRPFPGLKFGSGLFLSVQECFLLFCTVRPYSDLRENGYGNLWPIYGRHRQGIKQKLMCKNARFDDCQNWAHFFQRLGALDCLRLLPWGISTLTDEKHPFLILKSIIYFWYLDFVIILLWKIEENPERPRDSQECVNHKKRNDVSSHLDFYLKKLKKV